MSKLSPDAFYDAIATNITQDLAACNALLTLLQQEREQLIAREHQDLERIMTEKNRWLTQLEQSAQIRSQWLEQSPLDPQQNPTEAWQALLQHCAKPDIATQWEELKTLVQTCRDENEINGKLITRSQSTFKRLMNIIRGQDENPALYTGKGGKTDGYNKQTLGQA